MSAMFVLPGLISLYLVIRGRIATAFLSIYLPALLLLPDGYAFRLPHLPPISAAQSALIPIGAVAMYRLLQNGIPTLMDTLVGLFVVSLTASEILRERIMNDGIISATLAFISICFSYAIGRMLIEPGLRLLTVRRFVVLILLLGPIGLYEWRFGQSIYGVIGQRIFHLDIVQATIQLRAGRGRMAASFNDAELAGIVIGMTTALNVWLVYLGKWRSNADMGRPIGWLEKYHIPGLLLLLYLYLTQSRGPMLAVGIAYIILQIPRFRNKKTASVVAALLIAVLATAAFRYYSHYASISSPGAIINEQQGSALYRLQMNELYKPIVQQGGWLGWSLLSRPVLPGMFSIDNEYLLVHLAYGHFGYILFILLALETFRRLAVLLWTTKAQEDHAFVVSLIAAMAVFWISIATVYMGEQLPQITFLFLGWCQSIVPMATQKPIDTIRPIFTFKRILN